MKTAAVRTLSVNGFGGNAQMPRTAVTSLRRQFWLHSLTPFLLLVASLLAAFLWGGDYFPTTQWLSTTVATALVWGGVCLMASRGLSHHPHDKLGPANTITLYRAAGTAALAGWIPAAALLPDSAFWVISVSAVLLLAMDGVDGYLARRSGLASDFGARFDMEIDALLTLVMSLFLWQSGEMGLWIVSLGLMRYGFVLASTVLPALGRPLFPSFRRKLVCVIQLAALCVMLTPAVKSELSTVIGISACLLLSASFLRDIHWLLTRQS